MIPEIFAAVIAETRRKHGLPTNYRALDESACIFKFIPGQGNRRFLTGSTSAIEETIEVIVEADSAGFKQEELAKLCYYLISRQVGTNIFWNKMLGQQFAEYCASVILKPSYFQQAGRPVYKTKTPILDKNMQKKHKEITDYLCGANQGRFGLNTWCTQEAKEALEFVAFIGADSSDIPKLMDQLKERAFALEECFSAFELAAYIYNEIIRIHPYVDGNGRVARALMNTVLMNAGYSAIDIKVTKALENEYDHVVSRMDFCELSTWLKRVYAKQYRGMFLIDTQKSSSREETLDVIDQIDPIPASLELELRSYTKKTPGMFFSTTSPCFGEESIDLKHAAP